MISFIIIGLTGIISFLAFHNEKLRAKLILNPYLTIRKKQYYRLITHGFIHADWTHLIVNMLSFYFFAPLIEGFMSSKILFIGYYLLSIIIAGLPTSLKYKNNPSYNSLGASGGVAAIIFSFILLAPTETINIYFAIPIPAWIFGLLYLIYSQYMNKRAKDNINHDAHFWGSIYGFIFPLFMNPLYFFRFFSEISESIKSIFN